MPTKSPAYVLHRDDPDKDPLVGHVKVTREDWLMVARDALVNHGVGEVKVLSLGTLLGLRILTAMYHLCTCTVWYSLSRKNASHSVEF